MRIKPLLLKLLIAFTTTFSLEAQTEREVYTESALQAYSSGDLSLAAKYFGCIIDLFPNDSTAYFDRGFIHDENCEYQAAIADFTKQISIDKTSVDSYFIRGMVYEKVGRYNDALQDYKDVIDLEYENSDAHLYVGLLYKKEGKTLRAKRAFKCAVHINPKNAPVLAELGWAKYRSTSKKTGQKLIKQACSLTEENTVNALEYLALSLIDQGKNKEALEIFSQLFEKEPFLISELPLNELTPRMEKKWQAFSSELLCKGVTIETDTLSKAKLYLITQHPETAFHLLESHPNEKTPEFLYCKASCLFQMNRFDEAKDVLNILTEQFPSYPEPYLLRAKTWRELNELNKSCLDYNNYLHHTPATDKVEFWPKCQ